ncbi:MAG: protease SohB [Gammaproteobacteria bacterium]|nr:protease SohB [Gammaproteobacteria bacterium]
MEFLSDYGLFLAKTLTVVLAIGAVMALMAASRRHSEGEGAGTVQVHDLSERLKHLRDHMREAVWPKEAFKREQKQEKKQAKLKDKLSKSEDHPARGYVLSFKGDMRASAVECLREEVTAILAVARAGDPVLVRLESAGGLVHSYGLAASQLRRLRDQGLKLTVAVDKVAASGGYMMACVAEHVVAAPFAVLGSIGVVAQLPNFNRLLKKHDVDIELHTAGEFKRTLTVLGENTDKAREKFKEELEEAHALFKHFIRDNRPGLSLERVATGEHWYGSQALELGLVDELATSDDLLVRWAAERQVFSVEFKPHKHWTKKLTSQVEGSMASLATRAWGWLSLRQFQ